MISLVFSEGRKFLQLHSHSGKPWIDIWTFWLLVTLCSIPRSLQYNCSVNGSVWIFIWVINWVMWTQHSLVQAFLSIPLLWSKRSYWNISSIIIKFVFLWISEYHTFINIWGKIILLPEIDIVCNHLYHTAKSESECKCLLTSFWMA